MCKQNFELGTVVKLKSGGPKMTITSFGDDEYTCAWFDQNNKRYGVFNECELVLAE